MAGRRTVTNEEIGRWLDDARMLVEETNPPPFAREAVFNAALNKVQLDATVYSDSEFIEAVHQAIQLVVSYDFDEDLRAKAFHFALTGTSQREIVSGQIHLPNAKDKPILQ